MQLIFDNNQALWNRNGWTEILRPGSIKITTHIGF